jgi:DNA-binding NarL/FixJ family response regulator
MTTTQRSDTSPVRVVLVNDYELVVAGIRSMLEPYADRVCVVDTVVGSAELDQSADIALYDTFGRPDLGLDRIRALIAQPGAGHVVIYTSSLPPDTTYRLLDMGVAGCLSKSLTAVDLVRALERIQDGEVVVAMRNSGGSSDFPRADQGLSYRESEVLALLSQGLRNRAIATALYVGEETIKTHLKSVYRKLGVSNRGEAISLALRTPAYRQPGRIATD